MTMVATGPAPDTEQPVSRVEFARLSADLLALKALFLAHLPSIEIASAPGAELVPIKAHAIDTGFSESTLRRRARLPEGNPDRIELRKIGGRVFAVRR
jgi:hypothetical protein